MDKNTKIWFTAALSVVLGSIAAGWRGAFAVAALHTVLAAWSLLWARVMDIRNGDDA